MSSLPEGSEHLGSYFRKLARCTSVPALPSTPGADQTEHPVPSPDCPTDPEFAKAVAVLAEASTVLDAWPEHKTRYLCALVEVLGFSTDKFEDLTLSDGFEEVGLNVTDVNKAHKHGSSSSHE